MEKRLFSMIALLLVMVMLIFSSTSCSLIEGIIGSITGSTDGEVGDEIDDEERPAEVVHNHSDIDQNYVCDDEECKASLHYTYNLYANSLPTSLNSHIYKSSDNASEIIKYTNLGLYSFDYNDSMDGFAIVPEMAAKMPVDVTADYVGTSWNIESEETGRAYLIELRDDLAFENGDAITAYDFEESVKRLLNSEALNKRAEDLYSGDLKIAGAKNYSYAGRTVTYPANKAFESYSEELDSKLIFTLAPGDAECYVRTWLGATSSYDAEKIASSLIKNYGYYMPEFTVEAALAMEGKTLAQIKADPALATAWESATEFAKALNSKYRELVFCIADIDYPVVNYDTVGVKAISNTELVIVLDSPLEGFDLNRALCTDFGLVHIQTYDNCIAIDENGVYSNTYGTSVETYKSFGPYKILSFDDNEIVLIKNNEWYGFSDSAYEGTYQTTKIVIKKLDDESALDEFRKGNLDYLELDRDNIVEYVNSDSIHYVESGNNFFVEMNPNEEAYSKWDEMNPGHNKSILTVKEFRMALSMSLDRQGFINATDPMGKVAIGWFSNVVCSDVNSGKVYRLDESAKDALLEFWNISSINIGPGKIYADKDAAIAAIYERYETSNCIDSAKAMFDIAYDVAISSGKYNGEDIIDICIGTPYLLGYYKKGYDFLKENWLNATVGTKLEGKINIYNYDTLSFSSFEDPLRANAVDVVFSTGWGVDVLDPYSYLWSYIDPSFKCDTSWDTKNTMMEFEIKGTVYSASYFDWSEAISGNEVVITNVLTKETIKYSFGKNDNDSEDRIKLLAALESAVLNRYSVIPLYTDATAHLISYKVNYQQNQYIYGIKYGGVKYITYTYNDSEWATYIENSGGALNYK